MHLGALDIAVVSAYLGFILFLGFWMGRKDSTTEDYFVGGRKVPGWAVGLSIMGTCISSVTYVAYPGKSFISDWQYLAQGLMLPILVLAGGLMVVPFYRQHVKTSVNEFIEIRFGPGLRCFTLFVLGAAELARLSMVMYLVSLVIHTITDLPIAGVIVGIGIITMAYTVAGGIKGAIWTDVLQSVTLFAGGIVVVAVISFEVPGGFMGAVSEAAALDKFRLADFEPTLSRPVFYVLALSGILNFFYFLGGNQNQVQRYQCAGSDKEARRAALIGALGSVPVWALFMLVGTMLFVFYRHHPDPVVTGYISAGEGDKVFPHFIATALPQGLSGLLLAGLFAAAMSTLDSCMNSLSTMIVTDLYRRFIRPDAPEKRALAIAHIMTLLCGVVGIGLALAMTSIKTFLDFYFEIVAIIGGGIGGVFALALFSRRAHSRGVIVGVVLGLMVTAWGSENYGGFLSGIRPWLQFPWHPIMVGVVTSIVVWAGGYIASLALPPSTITKEPPPVLWDVFRKK